MKSSFFKVLSSIMTLLFVMIIPYFVGVNLMSSKLKAEPQITAEATASGQVLGASDFRDGSNSNQFISLTPEVILILFIASLFTITIINGLRKEQVI